MYHKFQGWVGESDMQVATMSQLACLLASLRLKFLDVTKIESLQIGGTIC
jgi:hypothetical protein